MLFHYPENQAHLCRLPHDGDVLEEINKICADHGITAGTLTVIGAVKKVRLGFYHQDRKEYEILDFDEPLEIVSCAGNISLKDGKPFAHLHVALSDARGALIGGHLMPGTVIFAAEACIQKFHGAAPAREFDPTTGLPLWQSGC